MRVFLHLILLVFLMLAFSPASSAFAAMGVGGADIVSNDALPQASELDDINCEMFVLPGSVFIYSDPLEARAEAPDLVAFSFWRPPRDDNNLLAQR